MSTALEVSPRTVEETRRIIREAQQRLKGRGPLPPEKPHPRPASNPYLAETLAREEQCRPQPAPKPPVEVAGYTRRPVRAATLPDKLVLAAKTLGATFSAADLTVAAWTLYPTEFRLRGISQSLPDHNRVVACLSNRNGPVADGRLVRVAAGRYRVREG